MEWSCKSGEVWDELLVEIAESDEGLYCFYRGQGFPISYSIEFGGIHVYFSILDH